MRALDELGHTSEHKLTDLRWPDRRTPMKVLVKNMFQFVDAVWTTYVAKTESGSKCSKCYSCISTVVYCCWSLSTYYKLFVQLNFHSDTSKEHPIYLYNELMARPTGFTKGRKQNFEKEELINQATPSKSASKPYFKQQHFNACTTDIASRPWLDEGNTSPLKMLEAARSRTGHTNSMGSD